MCVHNVQNMSKLKKKTHQQMRTPMTPKSHSSDQNPLSSQPMEMTKSDFVTEDDMPLKHLVQKAHLMFLLYRRINRFRSSSNPLEYRQEYNFSESWEELSKTVLEKSSNLLLTSGSFVFVLALLIMLQKILLVWYLSVWNLFQMDFNFPILVSGIAIMLADMGLKLYLLYEQASVNAQLESKTSEIILDVLEQVHGDLLSIIILVIQIATNYHSPIFVILDVVVIFYQVKRIVDIYGSVTLMLIATQYKHYVNLFGYVSTLFVIVHFTALFIFGLTLANKGQNWLSNIGKDNAEPVTKYILSIYFSATTMFTVGYGDILPITNIEKMLVIGVQVLGIVLIGYIVSQIGHTLSMLRQTREDFEQSIQNTDKICKYYRLEKDLKQRVRSYVINHQLANDELNINEENDVLMKLNEQLRNCTFVISKKSIIRTI